MSFTETEIQSRINSIKNFKNISHNSKEEIRERAIKSLEKDEQKAKDKKKYAVLGSLTSVFTQPEDLEFAYNLYNDYQHDFEFETVADKEDLRTLLFNETNLHRIQTFIASKPKFVDSELQGALKDTISIVSNLKNALGISKAKRKTKTDDPLSVIEDIKARAVAYINANKDKFIWKCQCGQINLLSHPHPFFKGNRLGSDELYKLVSEGKITPQEAAGVLSTSSDFIKEEMRRIGLKFEEKSKTVK